MGKPGVFTISESSNDFNSQTFRAHDRSHPQTSQIYAKIDQLAEELLQHGHVFDPNLVTRPMSPGETYQSILCGHSEKLALAFNLIQPVPPPIIEISKNLRVCPDCRAYTSISLRASLNSLGSFVDRAAKLIARLRQCHIVIRDAHRMHHFYPTGQCSCQDHF